MNKFRLENKIFLLTLLIFAGLFFINCEAVKAADCGDGVGACTCGDTVVANYTLPDDLSCESGSGLVIGSDNITIDGDNNTITGSDESGIDNSGGYDNVSIKNLNIVGFIKGIYFLNSTGTANQVIQNVNISHCWNGLYLQLSSSNNIIDSTFDSNSESLAWYGIYLQNSSNNIFTDNTVTSNDYGIYLGSSSSNTFTSNNINSNLAYGIYFDASSSNIFTSNNINSNSGYAIYFSGVYSNRFDYNIFYNNRNTLYSTNTTNTYSYNQFNHNKNSKTFTFIEPTRIYNVGDIISFNVSAVNLNGTNCTGCITATVYPSETIVPDNTWVSTNNPQGHFTATKSGTYSVVFTVTDSSSNVTKRILKFIVGDTQDVTTKYYYRGISPTHFQPYGNGTDSKSLHLDAASTTETWSCGGWVQNAPDELPNYPLSNLSNINIYTWYKQSMVTGGYIGIQRYGYYNPIVDYSSSVSAVANYTWSGLKSFDLSALGGDWMMDYTNNWYWLSLKLNGTFPYQVTFPASEGETDAASWAAQCPGGVCESSYANIINSYTTTPAVKSISNDDVNVLSATAPTTDTDDATIVLDYPLSGTATANIVLGDPTNSHPFRRPFQGYTTTINSDGTVTLAATGITSTATSIGSVPMDITPNAGTIAVSITTWNTSGDYSKQWTETGTGVTSASHTVGELNPNTGYTLLVDGINYNIYTSDENGQITFNYTGGYSSHTFEINPTNFTATVNNLQSVTLNVDAFDNDGVGQAGYYFYLGSDESNHNSGWIQTNTWTDANSPNFFCSARTYYVKYRNSDGIETSTNEVITTAAGCGGGGNSYIPTQSQPVEQQTQIQQKIEPEPEKQLTKEETVSQLKQQLIQLLTQVIQMLMQQVAEMQR